MQRRSSHAGRGLLGMLTVMLLLAGCAGSRNADVPPDERFGHRYEDEGPRGRRTITIEPPNDDRAYFTYPAVIDSVLVRHAPLDPKRLPESQAVEVEVLVKGAFPDGCYELAGLHQERLGHFINVTLTMRKPQGAVCTMALRPYRFYFALDGLYEVGAYRLTINEEPHPFTIHAPPEESR